MKFNSTKKELVRLYCQDKLTLFEIANKLNHSKFIIWYWMKKYNILRRNRSESKKNRKIKGKWVNCENCGKRMWRQQHKLNLYKHFFCSRKCFNIITKIKSKIVLICKNCGKKFEVLPSGKNRKYCSLKCRINKGILHLKARGKKNPEHSRRMLGKNNPNWQNGKSFEPYSPEFNKILKKKIKKKYDFTCQLCGDKRLKNTKKKFLCVHHINHNKKDCGEENLIPLCNLCNSSVNKSREDWTNFFQNKIIIPQNA